MTNANSNMLRKTRRRLVDDVEQLSVQIETAKDDENDRREFVKQLADCLRNTCRSPISGTS
jgi:chaperonin cofactor prefoldin